MSLVLDYVYDDTKRTCLTVWPKPHKKDLHLLLLHRAFACRQGSRYWDGGHWLRVGRAVRVRSVHLYGADRSPL